MSIRLPDARLFALPLLLAGITACSGSDSPTAPTPTDPPVPSEPSVFRVNVAATSIRVSPTEACDGRNFFTQNPENGEFHWRVQAGIGNNVAVTESNGYGSVTGTPWSRGAGSLIDFTDTDWDFTNLRAGDKVVVQLRGIEWDGLGRDSDLNDRSATFTIDADRIVSNTAEIDIGSDSCGMTLIFNYQVTGQ